MVVESLNQPVGFISFELFNANYQKVRLPMNFMYTNSKGHLFIRIVFIFLRAQVMSEIIKGLPPLDGQFILAM